MALGEHPDIVGGSCRLHREQEAETRTDASDGKVGYKAHPNKVTWEMCGRTGTGYGVYSYTPLISIPFFTKTA